VNAGRPKRTPTARALALAAALSLLLPGLGHVYMDRLGRGLIWFAGAIALLVVLNQGQDDRALALAMAGAIGVLAAIDAILLARLPERRP
jgi:hypothetical protein